MTIAVFVVRSLLWTKRFQTRYCKGMGRPREFQEQEVVANALQTIGARTGYKNAKRSGHSA